MRKQKITEFVEKHPIAAGIVVGTTKSLLMSVVSNGINGHSKVTVGHGRAHNERWSKMVERHPVAAAVGVVALSPFAEELVSRALPHSLAERYPHYRRHVEIGAVALFAAGHAGKDGLPLSQTVGGIVYNELYRFGGLRASFTAHATNNVISAAKYALAKQKSRS